MTRRTAFRRPADRLARIVGDAHGQCDLAALWLQALREQAYCPLLAARFVEQVGLAAKAVQDEADAARATGDAQAAAAAQRYAQQAWQSFEAAYQEAAKVQPQPAADLPALEAAESSAYQVWFACPGSNVRAVKVRRDALRMVYEQRRADRIAVLERHQAQE